MAKEKPTDDDDVDRVANITEERAARRFHQMHHQRQHLANVDAKIATAKEKLSALKEERDGYLAAMLAAADDEGDLPLFADLD
jgi:predicted deacetylase